MGLNPDKKFKISKKHNIDSFRQPTSNIADEFSAFSKFVNRLVEQEQPHHIEWPCKQFPYQALISTTQ